MSSIGNEKNTTIIFPVPIDILGHFMGEKKKSEQRHCAEHSRRNSRKSVRKSLSPSPVATKSGPLHYESFDCQPIGSTPSDTTTPPPKVSPSAVETMLEAGFNVAV